MTPTERNRLRRIRDLLDLFERQPAAKLATVIEIAAGDLTAAATAGDDQRRREQQLAGRELDRIIRER